jgi:hypothetical protein
VLAGASGDTIRFSGLPHRDIVEAALMDLPNHVSNTACVDNNGLRGMVNNLIHYDAASQRELGRRYAAATLAMNTPPVARAGNDTTVFAGDPVELSGTASSDSDNNPITYLWEIVL